MNGCAVLLEEKLEAELGLLAEAGFGDPVRDLQARLAEQDKETRHAAFGRVCDAAAQAAGEQSLRPLRDSTSFHRAVVAGLLDPVQGFDVQCAADVWGAQLPAHAPALRRFFSLLEDALRADEVWGPILDQYVELRFREDVLAALRERQAEASSGDVQPAQSGVRELGQRLAPPSPIQFQVVPGAAGERIVKVDFDYQLHRLQQITIEVKVAQVLGMAQAAARARPLEVGMLLGVGGLGDKSFNDSAYYGLESARQSYGIEFEADLAGTLEENMALLQRWAEADYDLMIGIGDDHRLAIAQAAELFRHKNFAIIDTEVQGENVWSAVFREYEGDYVVGVLAALVAQDGHIGFLGGVKTPVVRRIESAFWQGVKSVKPNVVLNIVYTNKFDDELIGRSLAEILYTVKGVDVIYQAAGRSGIGAVWAARELKKLIISTGGDHSDLAPATVLTSRIKNMYRPVLDVIRAVLEERFEGGKTASYGIANGGLSLPPVRPQVARRLPANVRVDDLNKCIDETLEAVTSGQIAVDLE
jgi:basic membrane protein A